MVKNQNWERRVEAAQTRRNEVKKRKQKSEDKRQYKSWINDLLRSLDQHNTSLTTSTRRCKLTIHVWTEMIPSDCTREVLFLATPLLFMQSAAASPQLSRRKSRSESMDQTMMESPGSGKKKLTRGRSNSETSYGKASKGKAHPRSFRDTTAVEEENKESPLLLCHSDFFLGKCREQNNKGKKACRHVHYRIPFQTLCQVVRQGENGENLTRSAEAVLNQSSETGCLDMVYYTSFDVNLSDDESDMLSSQIVSMLGERAVQHASVVYAAIDNTLVYDRNREGAVLENEREFLELLAKDKACLARRKASFGSENSDEGEYFDLEDLPDTVLEHILSFLPTEAIGAVCRVCKTWYSEIGQNSPNLWRHLLERQSWQLPKLNIHTSNHEEATPETSAADERQMYKSEFISHYGVVRNASAIKSALYYHIARHFQRKPSLSSEIRQSAILELTLTQPGDFLSLCMWGRTQVLAVYGDCTLQLFESISKSDGSGVACKEVVCRNVDPYSLTKRRRTVAEVVALDEECIGLLCRVYAPAFLSTSILVVTTREDFLIGNVPGFEIDADSIGAIVIDIGEAVLNYLLTADHVDPHIAELRAFLEDGGEIGQVHVTPSHQLAACGHGRFLLNVGISISVREDEDINIDERLILISSRAGALVWMSDSRLQIDAHGRQFKKGRFKAHSKSKSSCSVAVSSMTGGAVSVYEIVPSGEVLETQQLSYSSEGLGRDGPLRAAFHEVKLNQDFVVVVDGRQVETADTTSMLISSIPRVPNGEGTKYCKLDFPGTLITCHIQCIRNEYLLLLHEEEEVQDAGRTTAAAALILHIPSAQVIYHEPWLGKESAGDGLSLRNIGVALVGDTEDTLAAMFSDRLVVMAGQCIRDTARGRPEVAPVQRKVKNKKRRPKGNRKDAFTRGMSLRG